jgi:hypothetical protein
MPHYLLTGAGFSRNWGGWLADEAFEYLLGCDLTPHQRNLLWKHRRAGTGFEGVLQELRDAYTPRRDAASARELQTFDALLIGMFNAMNFGFGEFEPGRHDRAGPQPTFVRDFLCRFDAIFTLNQDTLLEQKYQRSDFLEGSRGRWFGFESPGLQEELIAGTRYGPPGVFRPHEPPFTVRDRYQPYFKLHGSSNWRVLNGSSLLVLGQNKGADIDNVALLDWYRGQFREVLSQPNAHLMIIGYSFRDPHINEIIYHGTSNWAKLFIIHPEGVGILDKAPTLQGRTRALLEEFQECITGASRRLFLSNFGNDTVELRKILRFFPQVL